MRLPPLSSRHARLALTGLAFGVALALGSVGLQRSGPEEVVVGNVCGVAGNEPCYQSVRNGGFPLGFVFDRPTVSVPYRLGAEDDLRLLPFLADVAFFWALLAAAWGFGQVRRRVRRDLGRSRRRPSR